MTRELQHCFGKLYDRKARECQICSLAIKCFDTTPALHGKSVIKSGYALAIANIISEKRKATVEEIKSELVKRFGRDERNIYYYLSVLKKEGLIDVQIDGRQRFYSVR